MSRNEFAALHQRCVTELVNCAKNVSAHFDDESKRAESTKFLDIAAEYCSLEGENGAYDRILSEWKNRTNFSDDYESNAPLQNLKKALGDHAKSTNPASQPIMAELQSICAVSRSASSLNDSDIVETACTQDYIDPISKKTFQRPVRNTLCGHVYDEASIKQLLKIKKFGTKCPVVGCANLCFVEPRHLVLDQEILRALTQSQSSQK